MKGNPRTWNSPATQSLVTILSMAALWGCSNNGGGIECGPGTELAEIDGTAQCQLIEGEACPIGTALDPQQGCVAAPNPCANVTCTLPNAAQTSAVEADGACACLAEACEPTYVLEGGTCLPEQDCPPGFLQEGGVCVPDTTASCYDQPESPLCIPTNCEEQPTSSPESGTVDLVAAGKCVQGPAPVAESCVTNCHNGIEDPHPWFGGPQLTCTGCHGGTADATTRETAHVAIPQQWQVGSAQFGRPNLRYYWDYNTLYGVERFPGGLEWLRFRQPSDLRVADQSCGKAAGCHQDRVENVKRSVMATEVGLVGVSQSRSGLRRSIVRQLGVAEYKYDTVEGMTLGGDTLTSLAYVQGGDNPMGSMPSITRFKVDNREGFGVALQQRDLLKEIYDKQCGDCHLGNNGQNNRYADFRSSGCAGCHIPYDLDGRSSSSDQQISKTEPTYPAAYAQISNYDANDLQNLNGAWLGPERAHPRVHRISKQMTSQKCGTCHVGSNRTDWQFRGFQIDPNQTAQAALDNNELDADQVRFTTEIDNVQNPFARYHGQAQNQVLEFVDWNDDGLDDIPADVHFQAGMECMDCHTSGEMHNEIKLVKVADVTDWNDPNQVQDMSGAIWSHMDQSTEVECVSCHGNLEYRALSYDLDNRNPVKNMIVCPENGEVIPGYTEPAECANMGNGRWLRSKFTGQWHYIPQTYDTVADRGARDARGGAIYSLNASAFHGRYNNDVTDGVGPCPNGALVQPCYKIPNDNNSGEITQGFSHLGAQATSPVDQHEGGLECYACHATWGNNCYGCHLRLADFNGNIIRDYMRSTGELTIGAVAEADFSYISPLDNQYGINSEGKIAQFLPETKMYVAHTDQNNNNYFGDPANGAQQLVLNDANIQYNSYRDNKGYGLITYDAANSVGLDPATDGQPYDIDARMNENAGHGSNQFVPHSSQRSHPLMDCENCHIDVNDNNTDLIKARFMANPNGFANVSAYLAVLENVDITRNNSNAVLDVVAAAGFRFDANLDPDGYGVESQSDYCVIEADAFPLCYNNHPYRLRTYGTNPQVNRSYPTFFNESAGPLNLQLMNLMFNQVKAANMQVILKGPR